jgi:lysophospholipid acyltransferase (LPLAT)-like uncharacterized protein
MLNILLGYLVYFFLKFLKMSYRFEHLDESNRQLAISKSKTGAYIFCMWHQNTVAGILSQWGLRHQILLSRSKDGDLLDFATSRMNYLAVRGSSSRGGIEARVQMVENIKRGMHAAITPDGPRGPAKVVKNGVIDMARSTGISIIPFTSIAKNYWTFNSWDKFRLPWPFTRILVMYGTPILIPESTQNEEFDHYKNVIAQAMNELEERAQKILHPEKN